MPHDGAWGCLVGSRDESCAKSLPETPGRPGWLAKQYAALAETWYIWRAPWPAVAQQLRCSQALKVLACSPAADLSIKAALRLPAGVEPASPAANCSIDAAHRLPTGLGLPQNCIHRQAALTAARGASEEQGLAPSQRRQRVQCLHGHPRSWPSTPIRQLA